MKDVVSIVAAVMIAGTAATAFGAETTPKKTTAVSRTAKKSESKSTAPTRADAEKMLAFLKEAAKSAKKGDLTAKEVQELLDTLKQAAAGKTTKKKAVMVFIAGHVCAAWKGHIVCQPVKK
jgi:Flp pilus assembly protein TadB